ncbi:MAG TPA: hypothetical protein PLF13_13935 [candidate division Zixibacteria bacterium]|nr:hypothetical protein [candidate division Zixibacteria bacterium]
MKNMTRNISGIILAVLAIGCLPHSPSAQINVEGDFRVRYYSDHFSETLDNRGTENYMRYLARIRGRGQINSKAQFYVELINWTENNPTSPVRNIAGTGKMEYGISQVFAEIREPNFLVFDLARLRVGRQQFPIGDGLTQGSSYYFYDMFDGVRVDLSYKLSTLSLFGAITGQNVSSNGLYPDPGSDQLFIARYSRPFLGQNFMGYYIYNKLRGNVNDSYIIGFGVSGEQLQTRLQYALEIAQQDFHTLDALPEKGGIGYMARISYRFPMGPFRSVKVETRYAAYQGDDPDTDEIEIFSPRFPSFFWGGRNGYVNGAIGGDYPYDGRNPEGTRLWYSRIYVVPKAIPKLRLQVDYLKSNEFVDNPDYNPLDPVTGEPMSEYNSMDDELSFRAYYQLASQIQIQFRLCQTFPNGEDADINQSGTLTWSEDRVRQTRYMFEIQTDF